MRVRIDIDEKLNEDEIIIRCSKLDGRTQKIYDSLMEIAREGKHFVLYKEKTEYFFPLEKVLFFETGNNCISAHTANDVYTTNYKLYELEEILPGNFMRVSKSTIINLNHIYSISRNLTASSEVQFANTHKQVYVSRYYYRSLKCRLEEKREKI